MARSTPADTSTALAEAPPQALATYDPGDRRGKESFEASDVEIPKIKIAQKTSPEIEDGHGKRIEGLKFTELFNSLFGTNYGKGPLNFIVIRHAKNAVLFDRKTLKVVERDVPLDDDRLKFGTDGSKPTATLFHNYLVYLPDTEEIAVLSLKGSQLKAAKRLNGQLNLLKGPSWSAMFTLSTATETFESGPAGVPVIGRAGKTPADVASICEGYYTSMEDFMGRADQRDEVDPAPAPDPDDLPF